MVILLLHLTDGMPGHGVEWNEQISKDWGIKSWMIVCDWWCRQRKLCR
jgi:hypothetical protein